MLALMQREIGTAVRTGENPEGSPEYELRPTKELAAFVESPVRIGENLEMLQTINGPLWYPNEILEISNNRLSNAWPFPRSNHQRRYITRRDY